MNDWFVFLVFFILLILYRLAELRRGKLNEKKLQQELQLDLVEIAPEQRGFMVTFHSMWFLSLFIEFYIHGEIQSPILGILSVLFLIFSMILRFLSMKELGILWSTKIYKIESISLKKSGIYKYLSYPNYLAVVLEFIFIPLLFKCYYTLSFFSLINIVFLKYRIKTQKESHLLRPLGEVL